MISKFYSGSYYCAQQVSFYQYIFRMEFSISEYCAYPTRAFRPAAYLRRRRFEPPLTLLTAQLTIKPRGVALTIISVKISIKVVRTTRREVRWAKGSSWLTAVYWFVIFWIWILPKMAYHFWSLLGTLCSCTQSHIIYVSRLVSCFLLVQWHFEIELKFQ